MATPALAPQTRIGPYLLLQKLGAGGIGEVWKARDTRLNRIVALKFIAPGQGSSPLRDLLREARAVSALNHPNIVTVYEVGDLPSGHYLAMEFVSGETLRARLRRSALPLAEALDLARQMAGGLAAAHKSGIIHRDLKPENIMLRDDGLVKLLDFGLAKLLPWSDQTSPFDGTSPGDSHTQSGQLVGTFQYMSPEQARGHAVTTASDIFSFGIVLYEMLTLEHPFRGQSTIDTLTAIINKAPEPISTRLPGLPPEFDALLDRMLQKESAARMQSAVELAESLQSVNLTPRSAAAPAAPAPAVRQMPRWAQAIGATLIVVLLAATGWLLRPGGSSRAAGSAVQSLVVMSLRPAADDTKAAAIADELTEDLDAALNRRGLRLASRAAIAGGGDPRTVGAQLGVDAVLQGTVRSFGDKLRIHVELVSTRTGFQIWSDNVTTDAGDPLSAADTAANQIADAVRAVANRSP